VSSCDVGRAGFCAAGAGTFMNCRPSPPWPCFCRTSGWSHGRSPRWRNVIYVTEISAPGIRLRQSGARNPWRLRPVVVGHENPLLSTAGVCAIACGTRSVSRKTTAFVAPSHSLGRLRKPAR
jgi:hypothetical protein